MTLQNEKQRMPRDLQDTGREKLFMTIEAALRGETLLQSNMLQLLLNAQKEKYVPNVFTEKELHVLRALIKGLKNSEIAQELQVAERTVKSYLTTIYSKLNVNIHAQAIICAIEKSAFKKYPSVHPICPFFFA